MSKTLMILVASTALTAALGVPAWSAMQAPAQGGAAALLATLADSGDTAARLILVDDDEDDDDDEGGSVGRRKSDDDDEGEDDDDDDDCEDDAGSCGAGTPAAAPAGSVAPPQNGLFGTGTPQVQVK
ncbi:hypothetical protein [Aestuariivirga litoralis]|uniref:hypothetical protein n=1 Tax=Aestuariivirga litoralis TaxID=2650924 RepID=UPI001379D06E|nr:hypothetical protein [Aestuariivirga litoralis]